jgi:ethylbenzene dioxygenase alpha subunit
MANAGHVTRQQKLCYGMALGAGETRDDLPGAVRRGQLSDGNQRGFYRRWMEMMDAPAWENIPLAPDRMALAREAAE